jgi:uncharacterized protein YecA (UPF0149 family)
MGKLSAIYGMGLSTMVLTQQETSLRDLDLEGTPKDERGRKTTAVRNSMANPKIGRNAPCPCGSGNKYKHCCMK